jgi:molybdenum cofactor guanylyltransferase
MRSDIGKTQKLCGEPARLTVARAKECGMPLDSPVPQDTASISPNARHARAAGRVAGLILAGGQARRLGGIDKGLVKVGGRTILARVRAVLAPHCDTLALSLPMGGAAWTDHAEAEGLLRIVDGSSAEGPLAGLAAAATAFPDTDLVTAPWDCPFLPQDLVPLLADASAREGRSVLAVDDERSHPSVAFWRAADLAAIAALFRKGERRLHAAAKSVDAVPVLIGAGNPPPFFNLNTPEDLAQLLLWDASDAA